MMKTTSASAAQTTCMGFDSLSKVARCSRQSSNEWKTMIASDFAHLTLPACSENGSQGPASFLLPLYTAVFRP